MNRAPARGPIAQAVDVVASAVLVGAGLVGFGPAFGGTRWAAAAGAGLALGLLLAMVGAARRWGPLTLAASVIVGYLLVAVPIAVPDGTVSRVLPTLDSTRAVLVAAIRAWKDVLTLTPPVGEHPSVLVVPLLTGLLTAVVTASLALRSTRPWWALLPAIVAFVTPIALGTIEPAEPAVQGSVFAAVAVGWAVWRRESRALATSHTADVEAGARAALARSRLSSGALMLVGVGAAAFLLVPLTAAAVPRHTLRETVVPPLDLRAYHSPLVGFRSYVKDHAKDVLFTVDGLPAGARIRLATLDGYDGVVYDVTEAGIGATFASVSSTLPGTGVTTQLKITSTAYSGVWVPDAGDLRSITFSGPRATTLAQSVYYNQRTGVAITTAGLSPGDTYELDVVLPRTWTDDELTGQQFATVTLPATTNVPDAVQASAGELAGAGTDSITAVRNLQTSLSTQGFFSHGLEGEAVSRSGHTAERIASLLSADQMIGDDEQYAVAMALMARQLGIPARVVMGFYPADATASGTVSITGDDVHAWVEVDFADAGWVAFDPTPPKDQTANQQAPKPRSNPKPQVLQPPAPLQAPAELPPNTRQDKGELRPSELDPWWLPALRTAALALIPALLLAGPLVLVAWLKRRRRRRRARADEPAARVSGGWHEVLDRAADLGTRVPGGATRRETAVLLAERYPRAELAPLAATADTAVFGAGEPDEADVAEMWRQVDAVVAAMSGSVGRWARLRARFSVRSLVAERRRIRPAVAGRTAIRRSRARAGGQR
ncbi:transglutaminase-like domain-containing protein [Pengzhenrongella sicca]|uniref:Transglutaminase domain-containing protein n=1 Tax=Pengzhenrongella sicca TaxID=2819238 RepID=A0A8A4ZAU2_9MICO|nr:transglutaminase-like domain-containing protein [Pengzhenrongella sicca]QTE28994.1 transglutaminase domain-containing protein [Pengzhenrongella sicca]